MPVDESVSTAPLGAETITIGTLWCRIGMQSEQGDDEEAVTECGARYTVHDVLEAWNDTYGPTSEMDLGWLAWDSDAAAALAGQPMHVTVQNLLDNYFSISICAVATPAALAHRAHLAEQVIALDVASKWNGCGWFDVLHPAPEDEEEAWAPFIDVSTNRDKLDGERLPRPRP